MAYFLEISQSYFIFWCKYFGWSDLLPEPVGQAKSRQIVRKSRKYPAR